jgi:hypothetical protein
VAVAVEVDLLLVLVVLRVEQVHQPDLQALDRQAAAGAQAVVVALVALAVI